MGNDVFEPNEIKSENEEIECSSCINAQDLYVFILVVSRVGTQQLSISSESKRKKYKYETTKEDVVPTFGREEVGDFNLMWRMTKV